MILTNVNVDLYKTFIAVFEAEKTTLASERLHIGQTGVSRNIRELERQLDIKLFHSHNKGVKPTKAAAALYPHIKAGFVEINNGESVLKEFKDVKKGHLRIGCHSFIANNILLDYICDFMAKHPLIDIQIISHLGKSSLDVMLENHDLEFIIDLVPDCKGTKTLGARLLAQLENTFYASAEFLKTHNLQKDIEKKQLSKLPVILYAKKHHTVQALYETVDPFASVFEVTTSELMYGMVRKNIACGYALTCFLDNCDTTGIEKLNIIDAELPKSNLAVITNRKDKSPIIKRFVDGLVKYCDEKLTAAAGK